METADRPGRVTLASTWGRLRAVRYLIPMLLVLGTGATAVAQSASDIQFYVPSPRVLCLYDSTDPGNHGEQDVLRGRVVPSLRKLGLEAQLHDISKGLPSDDLIRTARGVVTAFDDAAMPKAGEYVSWLRKWMSRGKKLVIFNNFGAYQDADTKKWLLPAQVNSVFRGMDVAYQGDWTDQGDKLRLVSNSKLLKRGFDVTKVGHYYRFSRLSENVQGHVVVSRTDHPDKPSYVVFTSPGGGMAMTRYYETVAGKEHIDRTDFLRQALFTDVATANRVLFILDPKTSTGHGMLTQLQWVMRYGWLQADLVTMTDAGNLRPEDLQRYSAVVVASDGAERLAGTTARAIERWVYRDGGGFALLFPSYRPEWDRMLGIKRRASTAVPRTGIKYGKGFFPGLEGLLLQDKGDDKTPGPLVITNLVPVSLTDDTDVFAHGVDVGSPDSAQEPAMWGRRHGQGRVVVRNDYSLAEKPMRGHVLQMIMHAQKVGVAPQLASMVYFVDDNPQPMWGAQMKPYDKATAEKRNGSEYKMSDTQFYRDVWWKEMLRQSEKHKVKLTFVLIFSYDDNVDQNFSAAPFYGAGGEGAPLEMARQAVALGHEVGLHGFNHQSLVMKTPEGKSLYTSKGWTSREAMVESLQVARVEWERVFGEGQTPFTYIAPNNHISRAGKEAVRLAFPEIRVMAAQYVRDGLIDGQEFGSDPDDPHFMDLPRVSSEFYIGAHNNLVMHDALMLVGAWTHFVHPDDVYDPERDGGMPWETLAVEQDKMFTHMRQSYPWLRSQTAREAYHDLVRFSSGPFHTRVDGSTITVEHGGTKDQPAFFTVRLDPSARVDTVENGRIVHTDGQYAYHFVEGYGGRTTIKVQFPGQ